jgi:DNA processing protein
MKINRISPDQSKYLQILDSIAKKPKQLYYTGKLPETRRPTVAIVGTRKPTSYGREVTARFAEELARKGVVVASGLALGVDAIAHTAAIEAGGTTLAILGNGLPAIYPAANHALAKRIIDAGGAILTEYDEGVEARSHQFLERNRIVSGLADAIIITEAAQRSGTLNTAAHALEQGKEVFVVPGNITSAMSLGCNALIRQGATPLTSSDDVLEAIAPELLSGQASLFRSSDPLQQKIIDLINSGIRNGDELQAAANCSATEFSTALTMLEINGAIRALGGNQWTIR